MFGRRKKVEAASAPPAPTTATADLGGGPWPWYSPTSVGRSDAMAVPTLAYIRAQLAGGVASMPLERYRQTVDPAGRPITVKLDPGWCAQPDIAPGITPSVFWSWVIDDLFFLGRSTLIVLARDFTGFPVAFRRVLPGQLTYDPETLAWGIYWPTRIWYMGTEVPPTDLVVISGPHEGICNYGAQTINAALALETNASNAAAEPLPNIDLHQTGGEPLSKTAAQALVSEWKTARAQGATAYTPSNLDARAIGYSAADQQMVEARQYMATQLARLAGVNPVLVSAAMGSSSSYVYTNQADYRGAFLDDVLDAYLQAIEGRLSENDVTPRGQYLEFDRDDFTRISLMERVQIMVGALKSGAEPAMVNQVAAVLDLDIALPEGPDDAPVTPPPAPELPPGVPTTTTPVPKPSRAPVGGP